MRKLKYIFPFIILCVCSTNNPTENFSSTIDVIEANLKYSIEIYNELRTDELVSPRSVENGKVKMVSSRDWTSGFFSGELWMMYGLTDDVYWKEKALEFTLPLEQEKWNGKTHDMGFKMFCSYGKAYEYTHNIAYRDVLIQSAKTLATRFNPKVGCIRSWDHNTDKWDFPVIIDNMMNLELLFWAAKETGNEYFKYIAVSHAEMTIKNHFRADNSSYHVVDYNPETGEVQNKNTFQGYSDESAWSRGQAWGLYGFTMVYRETGNEKFLKQAERVAEYILNNPHLPDNLIPYWDFDAPQIPNEPLDVSAAAIMASAFYELSTFSQQKEKYRLVADKILDTLLRSQFLAGHQENNGFLLMHSTGSRPSNVEVDVPIVYADYYFIESLFRRINY